MITKNFASRNLQETPRELKIALYVLAVGAGAVSLPFLGRYGPAPTTAMLDAWMVLFILTCIFRGRTVAWLTGMLILAYFLTRVVPVLANGSPIEDFLQAYRWILYLLTFTLAVGRSWGSTVGLERMAWLLIGMATIKAAATFALFGPGERPGLLLENNFELALFSGLTAVLFNGMKRHRFKLVALLGALILLSGSRSGVLAYSILLLYVIYSTKGLSILQKYMIAVAAPVLVLLPVFIFSARSGGATGEIDRLHFLDVFLSETSTWTGIQWLFGTLPITPLSPGACARLSFYDSLFASTGDGSCYSVILHAFLLRVVFDAGILGLLLSVAIPWIAMRRNLVPASLALTLTLIAVINGSSVSGINNPYVALPILLAVLRGGAGESRVADSDEAEALRARPHRSARTGW